MALRRPARLPLHNSNHHAFDSEDDVLRMPNITSRFKKSVKVHPVTTDFSLDTFSTYLEDKLKENTLEEHTLKLNPELARAGTEKEALRSLVNSSRPVIARFRHGRLEFRESNANSRRSRSVPASEADTDSSHRRIRSISGSGNTGTLFPDGLTSLKSLDRKQGSPKRTRKPKLQDRLYESAPPRVPSQHQDHTNDADSAHNNNRAQSFRDFTSGIRQSTRMHRRDKDPMPLTGCIGSSMDSDRARPRKIAGSLKNSHESSANSTIFSDSVDGNDDEDLSDGLEAIRAFETEGRRILAENWAPAPEAFASGGKQNAYAITMFHANSNAAGIFSPTTSASRHRKRSGAGKRPTGQDTFYSASSDDAFVSDQGEDDQADIVSRGVTEEADSLATDHASVLAKCSLVNKFDYDDVVPEVLPVDINQAHHNRTKIWAMHGLDSDGEPDVDMSEYWHFSQFTIRELNPRHENILGAPNKSNEYPRKWRVNEIPVSPQDPPICPASTENGDFPQEVLPTICSYLSSQEIRKLRLVNKATAAAVLPLMIRSTVVEFGRPLFDSTNAAEWDSKSDHPAQSSVVRSSGEDINKFGVSFTWDPVGLANAKPKVIEKEVQAWFGKYVWPAETYPRFQQLKELEDLVDSNRPLLKNTMKSLTRVHELALSVDSGHGWLNGPDISDLALFRDPKVGGSKVFGKNFGAKDKLHEFAIRQYFLWGQINTLNAYAKVLANIKEEFNLTKEERRFFQGLLIRSYDEFLVQSRQPDFKRDAHTGGTAPPADQQPVAVQTPAVGVPNQLATQTVLHPTLPQTTNNAVPTLANAFGGQNGLYNAPLGLGPLLQLTWTPHNPNVAPMFNNATIAQANVVAATVPTGYVQVGGAQHIVNQAYFQPVNAFIPQPALPPTVPLQQPASVLAATQQSTAAQRRLLYTREGQRGSIYPQWPLIFSGYNVAAEVGGKNESVQAKMARPSTFPYMPGELTEPQVQWLMETLWAQRAFLSAYINSVITNAGVFKNVHSLNIAKLSSGLIPSLAQDEFWLSLPNLRNLTLKISPDWRQEHVLGDKFFRRNMAISPVQSSVNLAVFLKAHITRLENLSVLRVGFVGGGEHQPGLFARNRFVLPAPITSDPEAWLTDHLVRPDPATMLSFNHIRDLTFENCWFSPCMLEGFMRKSKDTSLHYLTLDSVSLTGIHDTRTDGPLTTESHRLKCEFSPSEWLQETVPSSACWVNVLENITPGKTILERKYDADMFDKENVPRLQRLFRGNVQKITLNSCGYVKISGARASQFAQMGLVDQGDAWYGADAGLEERRKLFYVNKPVSPQDLNGDYFGPPAAREGNPKDKARYAIMMSTKDPCSAGEYFGLGKLTQCIHPVEKRVLERAWNMRFGWGDTMERFAAVEDGWFEGGTGRFSGTIERDN